MNKPLVILSVILGILLFIITVIYFIEPARFLPSFFPGYDRSLMTHHYKHGIGAFVLGVASLIFAWFKSGNKKSDSVEKEKHTE